MLVICQQPLVVMLGEKVQSLLFILEIGLYPLRVMLSTNHQPLQIMLVICQQPNAGHVGDKKPTTSSHVGGIDSVKKPRQIGRKPKFPCKICKGDHLTHLFLGLLEIRIFLSLSARSYDSKSSEVSSQPIQLVVEKVVTPMQSSSNPTLFLESIDSTNMVTPIQSLANPIPLL
jgi:hypothetical protein